jgi:hypothetical protein
MAKLIPNEIDQEDPRRDGERLVFEWLSDPTVPGTAFYSLLQKNHRHKLIGEVDFLYVCERGMLCIEVKGGQEIFREDQSWFSRNKAGKINGISNPFVQAKDCRYALKKYIEETYGQRSPQANYLMGYAVVFPECKFTGSGNDLVTEVMFDGRYAIDDFGSYLNSVFDYWEKLKIERHGYYPPKLTESQRQQIVNLLRGDFSVVPSMSLELQQIERKMLSLTEEQFDVLDITENNPRVIVQGCAGTGKSLLALEKVRACAAKEKKVLYLCFNKNMASYAKNSLADADQDYITVSTFHALLIKLLGDANLYKMSIKELCEEYLRQTPNVTLYDYIVIDEGQDLLIAEVFDIIDSLLVNGLNKGKWVMFLDPNQNIFNQSADYDFAMEYLRDCCSPVVYTLNYNCRNTEQIALRTAALSLVPPAKKLKITGPKVVAKSYDDRKDFVLKFKKELLSVVSGGLAAKDIVILSKKKLQNSLLSELNSVCNLTITEHENITDFSKSSFNFCTIQSYKGLESNIVFLIDVDGFADHHSRLLNYVAMSRAKLLLYIFYDQNCQEEYLDTLDKGRDMIADIRR